MMSPTFSYKNDVVTCLMDKEESSYPIMSVDALTRPLQASAVTGWMLVINKREYQLGYQGCIIRG